MNGKGIPEIVVVVEGAPPGGPLPEAVRGAIGRLSAEAALKIVDSSGSTPPGTGSGPPCRVLVNGEDVTAAGGVLDGREEPGEGPPTWMIEAALLRALSPASYLFLCVANSARSQMAEGIARALLPPGVKVWSAGSRPTAVRPEAIAVLSEIGIDLSGHRSKSVAEIPADEVDTVVTLCGEEECPVFLGRARRLHWGLPDPAAVQGAEEERLASFRRVRDELRRRLAALRPRDDEEER